MAKKKRIRKFFLGLLIVLIVLGVVIRVALTPVAVAVVNNVLPKSLTVDAELGDIDLSLMAGTVRVKDFTIEQHEGDKGGPMVHLKSFFADIALTSLGSDEIVIQNIELDGLELNLVRDADGVMNIATIVRETDAAADREPEIEDDSPAAAPPAILIERIAITNIVIHYRDEALVEGEVLDLKINQLVLDASNIKLMSKQVGEELPGSVMLYVEVDQGEGKAAALIGLRVALGAIHPDDAIPAVNATLRISGLYLETLDVLVPPATAAALGGSQLDTSTRLQISHDYLMVQGKTITKGNIYELNVSGTPDKPKVNSAGLFFDVFGRFTGSAFNAAANVGQAGVEIGKGVVKGGAEIVEGAGGAVKSFGKGLFGVAKGVVTLDMKEAGEGLSEATVGTVKGAGGAIAHAGGEIAHGVADAGSAATGADDNSAWAEDQMNRWNEGWQQDELDLAEMPYPGTGPAPEVILEEEEEAEEAESE